MSIVAVLGAKGGVGASLIATNLGAILAQSASTILVDLNGLGASDDLYLDLKGEPGWQDLMPVAGELTGDHLTRVVRWHSSGLGLIASTGSKPRIETGKLGVLIKGLRAHSRWVLLDLDYRCKPHLDTARGTADQALIVTAPDPPSLRAAGRLRDELQSASTHLGLVLNQMTVHHPASPASIAASLELPLAGCVWHDPSAAAYQVNMGELVDSNRDRGMASALRELAGWVRRRAEVLTPGLENE